MIPYHGYDTTALVHHHPAYATNNNPVEQEVPKYARLLFKLPRVVPQQKDKFEEEDIFKKHSRDTEVKYTLYRDRPAHERQAKFQSGCRDGHTELVHICSSFILNGVCVRWRGWLCLEKLEGVGCLELDLDLVSKEENLLQRQLALVQQKLRECEELYRGDYHMKKLPGYT